MSKTIPIMRKHLQRAVVILACGTPLWSAAQTGQTLIANPLLSPAKLKEVKRQILESAHKELVPPAPPAPPPVVVPPPNMMPPQFNPAMMGAGMPAPVSPNDTARTTLAKLQVMTIVGDAAILASSGASPAGRPSSGMPNGAAQMGMPMPQAQLMGAGAGAAAQDEQPVRRSASTLVRNGQRTLVEGVEVMASIVGDTVQLLSMSNAVVYQGSPQPAVYSPSAAINTALRERPNNDYVNMSKPEPTSMSGTAGNAPAGQSLPQSGQMSSPVPRPLGY